LLTAMLALGCLVTDATEPPIIVAADAGPQERLAAREILRYVYLRTGRLLEIRQATAAPAGPAIVVANQGRGIAVGAGTALGPEQYRIAATGQDRVTVVGGDGTGTLYGAYRLAERLGVRFYLH